MTLIIKIKNAPSTLCGCASPRQRNLSQSWHRLKYRHRKLLREEHPMEIASVSSQLTDDQKVTTNQNRTFHLPAVQDCRFQYSRDALLSALANTVRKIGDLSVLRNSQLQNQLFVELELSKLLNAISLDRYLQNRHLFSFVASRFDRQEIPRFERHNHTPRYSGELASIVGRVSCGEVGIVGWFASLAGSNLFSEEGCNSLASQYQRFKKTIISSCTHFRLHLKRKLVKELRTFSASHLRLDVIKQGACEQLSISIEWLLKIRLLDCRRYGTYRIIPAPSNKHYVRFESNAIEHSSQVSFIHSHQIPNSLA